MKVGFFTVFRKDPVHYALAGILVRSIRAAMPDVEIVHMTDETSPTVLGVDTVVRKPHGKMLERRMEHYAECSGDWLLLDTDTVMQKDVRHVFEDQTFAVAMADRKWNKLKDHWKYGISMPFNTGVVFSRTPDFYRRALELWRHFPADKQGHWWSEQWAVAETAHEKTNNGSTPRFAISVLPGMIYNRPPATQDEDVSEAAILHFKGPERKLWMITRYLPNQGYENALKT